MVRVIFLIFLVDLTWNDPLGWQVIQREAKLQTFVTICIHFSLHWAAVYCPNLTFSQSSLSIRVVYLTLSFRGRHADKFVINWANSSGVQLNTKTNRRKKVVPDQDIHNSVNQRIEC